MRELFGSIRQRQGRYLGRYRVGGRDYYTPTRRAKSQVRADLVRVHAAILDGTWADPRLRRADTLETWADTWLDTLEERDYSPNTVRTYRANIRAHIIPALGARPLDKVTPADLASFYRDLRARRSTQTAQNIMRTLASLLNAAVKADQLAAAPAMPDGWTARARRKARPVTYTPAQLDALIAAATPHYRAALILASYSALRSGEILALKGDDFPPDAAWVRVDEAVKTDSAGRQVLGPPKSQAGYRANPIPARWRETIRAHVAQLGPSDLAYHTRTGRPLKGADLLAAYRAAAHAAGLPSGRFHDLRHSGLTLYGQAGATLAELMAIAGHSDVATVMIYQHAGDERIRALSEAASSL